MMVLDHVGDDEAMVYAQRWSVQPLARILRAPHSRRLTGTETGDALLFERAAS